METKFRKKEFAVLATIFHVGIPLIGGYMGYTIFGGYLGPILFAALLSFIASIMDSVIFPRWQYKLTWNDIELALHNLHEYGIDSCELWFRVDNRRIKIYRDEQGDKKNPIRMEVSIPCNEWNDLIKEEDFYEIGRKCSCNVISSKLGKEDFYFFAIEDSPESPIMCRDILNYLFTISAGGLRPDIMAESHDGFYWRERNQREAEKLLNWKRFLDGAFKKKDTATADKKDRKRRKK